MMTRLAEIVFADRLSGRREARQLRTGRVQVLGVRAWVAAAVNDAEWQRRERAGLGGLTGLDVLDGLLGLPLNVPIPVQALTGRERRLVQRLSPGVVDQHDGVLVRRAEPVLEVVLAVVFARAWAAGLVRASAFASYCPRLMVLPSRPADEALVCAQASYYGVGISVAAGNDYLMLVAPEPVAERRVTAAGWWFAEEVYQQLRGVQPAGQATLEDSPRP
jgi:hypothetical protein